MALEANRDIAGKPFFKRKPSPVKRGQAKPTTPNKKGSDIMNDGLCLSFPRHRCARAIVVYIASSALIGRSQKISYPSYGYILEFA